MEKQISKNFQEIREKKNYERQAPPDAKAHSKASVIKMRQCFTAMNNRAGEPNRMSSEVHAEI